MAVVPSGKSGGQGSRPRVVFVRPGEVAKRGGRLTFLAARAVGIPTEGHFCEAWRKGEAWWASHLPRRDGGDWRKRRKHVEAVNG